MQRWKGLKGCFRATEEMLEEHAGSLGVIGLCHNFTDRFKSPSSCSPLFPTETAQFFITSLNERLTICYCCYSPRLHSISVVEMQP